MWVAIFVIGVVIALALYVFYWSGADPAKINPDDFVYDIEEGERKQQAVTETREKFLIIGAGFTGLGLAGALKRHGIPFDSVEKQDRVGGNWYSGVYNHVHILSSKATTEFKDFPMPKDYPDFPSGKQMCDYLNSYAEHFGLTARIQLNTSVTLVRPYKEESGPYKDKELWEVHLDNGEKRIYKGILTCIGHHWSKRIPSYPGQETFTGTIIHSKDYKDSNIFNNKRVLIVGGGNSACDINVEAARCAAETHSSMRRGYWFLPRTIMGVPFVELIFPWMPIWFQRLSIKVILQIVIGSYTKYGLQEPDHKIFEQHPTINTEILNYLKLGKIKSHPDIKQFQGNTVEFVDGTKQEIDLIVFATGYNQTLPMFEPGFVEYADGIPRLIGGGLHPNYKNLYIVGVQQPRYGAGPLITLGGEILASLIKIQEQMKFPIAKLAMSVGMKPIMRNNIKTSLRTDRLEDPHVLCKRNLVMKRITPYLPTIEKWLITFGVLK